MKMTIGFSSLFVLALMVGCGVAEEESQAVETPQAESNPVEIKAVQPVAEAVEKIDEPEQMSELQVLVGEYEKIVKQKLSELEVLKKKVKEIPIGEIVEEQSKVLETALDEVAVHLGRMRDELVIYLEELTAKKDQKDEEDSVSEPK